MNNNNNEFFKNIIREPKTNRKYKERKEREQRELKRLQEKTGIGFFLRKLFVLFFNQFDKF